MHLVASASPDERVVVCADSDWEAARVLDTEIDTGRVLFVSTAVMYDALLSGAPGGAEAQLRELAAVVEDSLAVGYAGVRVVADNTALLAGRDDALDRWLTWEQAADAWQAVRPVTGVCYFAADRVDGDSLAAVGRRHPLTGGIAEPTWFVHHDLVEGVVAPALVGAVEAPDVAEFARIVRTEFASPRVDPARPPLLDLSAATYLHHRAVEAVGAAAMSLRGRPAQLANATRAVGRLCAVMNLPTVQLL